MATKEFFYDILRSEYQSHMEQKCSRSVIEGKSLTAYGDLITKLVKVTLITNIKSQPLEQIKTLHLPGNRKWHSYRWPRLIISFGSPIRTAAAGPAFTLRKATLNPNRTGILSFVNFWL